MRGKGTTIPQSHKVDIHRYIIGLADHRKSKVYAINSMPDHIHILTSFPPTMCVSDLVRDIKSNSSRLIADNKWSHGRFRWQTGYGAFSYGASQLEDVKAYIRDQEEHHRKRTWREEYIEFLDKFGIEYDPRYVFDPDDEDEAAPTELRDSKRRAYTGAPAPAFLKAAATRRASLNYNSPNNAIATRSSSSLGCPDTSYHHHALTEISS